MKRQRSCAALWIASRSGLTLVAFTWAAVAANEARAAAVTLELISDPNSANNGCVGCTLNGPGTWDLYLSASQGDNYGIAGYQVGLLNTTSILHRSPRAYLSTDPEGIDPELQPAGFMLLRSSNNSSVITGSQDTISDGVGTPYLVHGFGQTASSFQTEFPGTTEFLPTAQTTWAARLLIAEGTYNPSGPFPGIIRGTAVANVFTSLIIPSTEAADVVCLVLGGPSSCNILPPPTPVITDFTDTADLNEIISHTLVATNSPTSWGPPLLSVTYTPMFGAEAGAPGLSTLPTWNRTTQAFRWDTRGSSRGRYSWQVSASNAWGSDTGRITIDVPFVPEPATLTLFGLAMVGFAGVARRRS